MRSFWSCYTEVDRGDLQTYADSFGHAYEYDSNVVNCKLVAIGDVLVIRDRHLVYGYGVVEDIDARAGEKKMLRCPLCRSADLGRRKRALPEWRCNDCKAVFDVPIPDISPVTVFTAAYSSWWMPFVAPAPRSSLETVFANSDRQNAIRRLSQVPAQRYLQVNTGVEGRLHLELLRSDEIIRGGHVELLRRQRLGQDQFRSALLRRHGSVCAVTGPQPEVVLDAAHLRQFAHHATHELRAGLLLRADIHRLFDRLLLTFDPDTSRTAIAPALLARHRQLEVLADREMVVGARAAPDRELVGLHRDAALRRWRDSA